jgi:virginiamycin B lyase
LDPNKRTLVFIHGIASGIASTYPPGCANSIAFQGGYAQAIGYDYDWTDPPKVAGPTFQATIDRLGLKSIDIEAHSYGAVVALQALPQLKTPVRNMVLLAGPLPRGGTPAATFPQFFRDWVLRNFLHADPGAVQRAENKKMLASIAPQSQDLSDITRSILPLAASAPEFIEAAGTKVPPQLIDETFTFPFLAGFNDGLVPVSSALSTDFDSFAPQNFTSQFFDVDHGHIVCDGAVQAFVAKNLRPTPVASPGPPVAPSPGPPVTPSPGPPVTPSPGPPVTPSPGPPVTPSPAPPVTPNPIPSDTPGAISEYPIPLNNPNSLNDNYANGITAGRDLALWFTFGSVIVSPTIGRMTTDGHFTKYPLSSSETQPWGIVAGSDGNLWFTEVSTNKIARMSTSGVLLQEFTIPTPTSYPYGLVFGADSNLWFIESRANNNKIGRMTMSGQFQEFPVNAGINGTPEKITAGQDGGLWFTESDAGRIGRISTDGTGYKDYVIGNGAVGHGIAAGPDGALWFTSRDFATIGRITTSGQYTAYPIWFGGHPQEIVYGPDGAM